MLVRKKKLCRVLALSLAVSAAGMTAASCPRRAADADEPPPAFSAPDLPPRAVGGSLDGRRIRVLLRYPVTFGSDPLVGVYSPSQEGTVPATMEFHFSTPPAGRVLSVTGTVAGLRFDNLPRWNRVPGRVVMVSCESSQARP